MSQQKQASIQDSLNLISTFLQPIREQQQKEAEMKTAAEDNSTSFKDTKAANPEEQAKQQSASTTQTNLGKEQSQLAKENNPNPAPDAKPNSEEDAGKPTDDQGTQTLTTDDKVKDKGNIGPTVQTEITQEQKAARADRLGNAILETISYSLSKTASDKGNGAAAKGQPGGSSVKKQPGGENKTAPQAPGRIPNDLDDDPEGGEKTAVEKVMDQIDKTAAVAAQEYFEGYRYGMLKRAQDEMEVENAGIDNAVLEKMGGVQGLLDKVAMEFPEAVMPEEVMAEEVPPVEGAPMAPPVPPEGGEMPEELGMEGDPVEAIAAALDEADVTPEELQQAMEDVQALQEAGVPPEELANALTEIVGDEGAPMDPAAEPAEEQVEEPVEKGEEKVASEDWTAKVREILSR